MTQREVVELFEERNMVSKTIAQTHFGLHHSMFHTYAISNQSIESFSTHFKFYKLYDSILFISSSFYYFSMVL